MIFLAISSSSLKPKKLQNVVFARENKVFDDSGLPVGGIWVWSCPIWFVMFWPQATATSHKQARREKRAWGRRRRAAQSAERTLDGLVAASRRTPTQIPTPTLHVHAATRRTR